MNATTISTPTRWIDTVPADRMINLPSNPNELTPELVQFVFTPEHRADCARELARLVMEARRE